MARSHDQGKLDQQLESMRRACQASAERHGASVDFRAEEIYQTYKIPEDARAGCSRHDHVGAADAIGAIGRQRFVRT